MIISRTSKIEENTRIHIINGDYFAYIIRDCLTKELILYIPIPIPSYDYKIKKLEHKIKKINQESIYEDIFPSNKYSIKIRNIKPSNLKVNNLPFELKKYATDQNAIYEITNACDGYPLITSCKNPEMLAEITIELKNLVTDEIITKRLKDIHVEDKDFEFNYDLINLMNSKDLAVKSYLKAAYLYSKDFKQKIDKSQELIKN